MKKLLLSALVGVLFVQTASVYSMSKDLEGFAEATEIIEGQGAATEVRDNNEKIKANSRQLVAKLQNDLEDFAKTIAIINGKDAAKKVRADNKEIVKNYKKMLGL